MITVLFTLFISGCGNSNTAAPSGSQNAPEARPSASQDSPTPEASAPVYEPADINIGGMTGPTSMGMIKIMESAEAGTAKNNY